MTTDFFVFRKILIGVNKKNPIDFVSRERYTFFEFFLLHVFSASVFGGETSSRRYGSPFFFTKK